ncbi:MAG: hypothetical protein Hyperionvirus2_136 [Hyperionvirus sp.]|uniref:Uncharacterized protein n=1 Tax=Hyperionvirus sp. TaxID=2487770 RepID=A0A3G5A6G5_9VIRU|nr:MAG: hypothetical protein Hyperionvirus2_136 [Hyperionvirus sp.]
MNYQSKYRKYKRKYSQLKRQTDKPYTYIFKQFDINNSNDLYEQMLYIRGNVDRILELMLQCFPGNINRERLSKTEIDKLDKDYIDFFKETRIMQNGNAKWFFVLDGVTEKIIGVTTIESEKVNQINDAGFENTRNSHEIKEILGDIKSNPYVYLPDGMIDLKACYYNFEDQTAVIIRPVIQAICKDAGYSDVGRFLLNNIFIFLKKAGYNVIYLVPESGRHKPTAEFILCAHANRCYWAEEFGESYRADCLKLIEYYKTFGFSISEELFVVDRCGCGKNILGEGMILYNVLSKQLN